MKKHPLAQTPEGIYNPALIPEAGRGEGIEIISKFLTNFLGLAFVIGTVLCLGYLIIGAIQFITAGGDKTKTESARGKIVLAITGLAILFSIFAIMKLIGMFFGIEQLESLIFNLEPYFLR